jgi:hypothetical protein
MHYNDYRYSYARLMQQAEAATSRKEALHLIRQAQKLQEVMALTKTKVHS